MQQVAEDVGAEFLAAEDDSPEYHDVWRRMGAAADERHEIVWSQATEAEQIEMHWATGRWYRR